MDNVYLILFCFALPLAVVLGILGPIIIWRKMAYFGDSLAHSSLLGLAIGIFGSINQDFSIFVMALIFALILWYLKSVKLWAVDSLLGLLAHSSLGLGLLVFSILNIPQSILYARMFGDYLAVDWRDFAILSVIATLAVILIHRYYHQLLLVIISEDLAQAEGVNVRAINIANMIFIALVIALSSKIIGILLVSSLLIIPAMSARLWVKSPFFMIFISCIITFIACVLGIFASINYDIALSPAIVTIGVVIFIFSLIATKYFQAQ